MVLECWKIVIAGSTWIIGFGVIFTSGDGVAIDKREHIPSGSVCNIAVCRIFYCGGDFSSIGKVAWRLLGSSERLEFRVKGKFICRCKLGSRHFESISPFFRVSCYFLGSRAFEPAAAFRIIRVFLLVKITYCAAVECCGVIVIITNNLNPAFITEIVTSVGIFSGVVGVENLTLIIEYCGISHFENLLAVVNVPVIIVGFPIENQC